MRNPFDRLASAYTYYKNGGNQKDDLNWKTMIEKHYPTFKAFVLDGANNPKLNFIGRFEQLATHWEKIRQIRPGLESLQKSNGMERPKFRDSYDHEMIQVLKRVYRLDLENFGYAFEGVT